jgi:hypothetical protein
MASVSPHPDVAHRVNILCAAGYAPATANELATTPVGAFGVALLEAGYSRPNAIEISASCPWEQVQAGAAGARAYADMFALCNMAGLREKAMGFFRDGTTRPQAQSILCRILADASDALVTDSTRLVDDGLWESGGGRPVATVLALWKKWKGLQ